MAYHSCFLQNHSSHTALLDSLHVHFRCYLVLCCFCGSVFVFVSSTVLKKNNIEAIKDVVAAFDEPTNAEKMKAAIEEAGGKGVLSRNFQGGALHVKI